MFRALFAALPIVSALPAAAQARKKPVIAAAMPSPDDRARAWLVLVDDKDYAQVRERRLERDRLHRELSRDAAAFRSGGVHVERTSFQTSAERRTQGRDACSRDFSPPPRCWR